jgi:hypothetical protein
MRSRIDFCFEMNGLRRVEAGKAAAGRTLRNSTLLPGEYSSTCSKGGQGAGGSFDASGYNTGMVIHTFAFRWKAGVREEEKLRAIAAIRGLQGKIPGLLETWVGVNFSPRSQGYELGGTMKFADRAALEAYGGHPVHQELLQWLMPLIDPVEVDFEA